MRERILEEICRIEDVYDVKVCFAVESGSRAWGLPSKDSDYDVRFIYLHRRDWYLSIDEKRDVIELPISDLLDINGWDVRKALKLFRKSNPPLMEWLHSGIVYYKAFSLVDKMKAIQDNVFIPKSALYHYLHMATGNYRNYLQAEQVKIKKYFYVLRPILACNWIEKYNKVPPIIFQELVDDILPNGLLKKEILTLLERKINGEELNRESRIPVINEFVENEINRLQEYLKTIEVKKEDATPQLDLIFRQTLDEVWS
ncbi:nucleotidyltransferase domain-containing protein [Neobacillus massiliamazoniensis]|uniref:YcgL n=1 Tax=Neobacillus massiliamazoniensis TaxID=1499688 RepID=A0A0U1NSN1_9BACI|nr:nucleotidyltransferase domain-containing protein [Neobacillus massiliamazoniensis]CRK80728.1 YcgL [Neobacillus massiliamazoniensis]